MSSAEKTKPALWKRIVASVKRGSKGGPSGKWTARKAQLSVQKYKKQGGGYRGRKKASNKLAKWTKQKWDYVSKGDEKKPRKKRGRYLPKKVRESLTAAEKAATNRRKRTASARGKSSAKYSRKVARKVSRS
tara:strand:- start:1604 stop:1999 length:396 start_codon:yes stop_codon:yes gene_type:complete